MTDNNAGADNGVNVEALLAAREAGRNARGRSIQVAGDLRLA